MDGNTHYSVLERIKTEIQNKGMQKGRNVLWFEVTGKIKIVLEISILLLLFPFPTCPINMHFSKDITTFFFFIKVVVSNLLNVPMSALYKKKKRTLSLINFDV